MRPSSPLTVESIHSALATRALGHRIELLGLTDSTNRTAFTLAQAGAEHGTVVVAEGQTDGRGRMGRSWFSPPGVNLYCSIVLRKAVRSDRLAEWLSWLPLTTALAAAEAIRQVTGVHAMVKWPNDLLIAERKVGGILCENSAASDTGPFQIAGIGINVNGTRDDFPSDIVGSVTTLHDETGRVLDRNRLLSQLLIELEECVDKLHINGQEQLAIAYRQRCSTLGQMVRATLAQGNEYIGIAEGIGPDGSLHVARRPAHSGGPPADVLQLRAADIVHLRPSQMNSEALQ
ncbi:MAG TPA: biotin--[acetyl-CoA-carboxylase] ligase [Nitrospira sp.]